MIDLLIDHLLESTLFCIALGSVTLCLRRQRAEVRHTLWLIGVFKFSIPSAPLAATGAWMAFVFPAAAWLSSLAAKLSAVLESLIGIWHPHIAAAKATLTSLVVLAIWILGSATMFGAWFSRLRKSYEGLGAAPVRGCEALDRAKQRLGFRANVCLRSSNAAREPALIGVFHPVIAIPTGLSETLALPELESVLLHELAHARRHDNLASAFVHCLVCIFWFHPLLRFVENRLIAERERACDEIVIESGIVPENYLAGLAKVCKFHLFRDVAGVSAMGGSDLKARFDHIQSCRVSRPIPYAARLVAAGLALLATILPIAGGYCEQCVSNGHSVSVRHLRHLEQR